ncbi:MAG: hypothetical protein HGA75_00095 [Thiobacillus sp.]|nr:hypothetical protein [Thiobacillus sp.]
MPRDGQRHQHLRQRIAQLAARLMMEHGIKDHAMAKRKAARQLGVTALNGLPSNEEIDAELRMYATLFEPDSGPRDLDDRRRQAIEVMVALDRFRPVLVGGLAQGVAVRHADIELEVYADSSKEFEQFLLNADIEFKTEERREGSIFTLFSQPADVQVRVLPVQSMHSAARESMEARRRLSVDQLRQILARTETGAAGSADPCVGDVPGYQGYESMTGSRE